MIVTLEYFMAKEKKVTGTMNKAKKNNFINKIVYFDKETIRNILQEYNKGAKQTITNEMDNASFILGSSIEAEANIKIALPFFARLKFLFSSKMSAEYISQFDKTVTVTSTEISDFEKIKGGFKEFSDVTVSDIENSSTFFRVAGNYMRILKGGVKDVDTKEFKNVMEGYEGYDHYKINDETYIRFNSAAFLSNYRRNDLLNSRLKVYCIFIGTFPKASFDFLDQLYKMQNLTTAIPNQTIGDIYPNLPLSEREKLTDDSIKSNYKEDTRIISLYDVVYASISPKEE